MEHRKHGARLNVLRMTALTGCLLLTQFVLAKAPSSPRGAIVQMDRATLHQYFRSFGYRTRGGIDKSLSDSNDPKFRSLTHFSSSFSVGGVNYPFTMLGYPPRSGRAVHLKSVIVPLRMRFVGFGPNMDVNIDFSPATAVTNIVNSPMYQEASFVNGVGQFGDQMQRAAFWNKMDDEHEWHVEMARPRIMHTIDIEVTPETGMLFQLGANMFGNVLFDFLDSQARTIIQLTGLDPDEVPIFVTDNVIAEALGYHNAYAVSNPDGSQTLQTLIYTSWLDPALVDPIIADVSTFNHEELEWINDPFVNNVIPTWMYPPPSDPRIVCSGNNLLEVGDPQGNGPTFDDFPTIVVPVRGVQYHLQQLVLFQWFTDEVPSSALNGWFTFPDPSSLTVPAVYCP